MRKKTLIFICMLLISNDLCIGINRSTTKYINRSSYKKLRAEHLTHKTDDRIKRSLGETNGNKQSEESDFGSMKYYDKNKKKAFYHNNFDKLEDKGPFWGNRGQRNSNEDYSIDDDYIEIPNNYLERRNENDHVDPFWGNRGRRSSNKRLINKNLVLKQTFEQNDEEPFWGTRGRRENDEPFWGNRGRRDSKEEYSNDNVYKQVSSKGACKHCNQMYNLYGRNGFEQNDPFWGNRGRRNSEENENNEDFLLLKQNDIQKDKEQFWGARGRREDDEPFWGNRGRRDDDPFWGARGRRDEVEPFWGNRGRRREHLQKSIQKALHNLSRFRRSNSLEVKSFWSNTGRDSTLKYLFSGPQRFKTDNLKSKNMIHQSDPATMREDQMFADQPHFILVERNSRSSGEDDPYIISRGKKKNLNISNVSRGRRGAIEDIMKSMKADPYFIARGKKYNDDEYYEQHDSTKLKNKEEICSSLAFLRNGKNEVKREASENDRNRRNNFMKLAAQLQKDPYYVSRGKKGGKGVLNDEDFNSDIIRQISAICEKNE